MSSINHPPREQSLTSRTMADGQYRITLYTYYGCPYAHRVHIALEELGLRYEKVHIDLDVPREPWYLQVNPVSAPLRFPPIH
jgi:hypothetical protein